MVWPTLTPVMNEAGDSIMRILDFLYEEYCRARLVEMRKQLLLRSPQNDKPAIADSADSDSTSDYTEARQHEGDEAHHA